MKPLIIISGPTASGKTDFAIKIAKKINGEIVSADSMQIYKKMNIGTAKPNKEEMDGVRHHLLDIVNPSTDYSLSAYVQEAKKALNDIWERGKIPIITGGTGLYIDHVVYNIKLADISTDLNLRKSLMQEAEEIGNEKMLLRLRDIDPQVANKLHSNDIKRIVRALEIFKLTGKTKSQWDKESKINEKIYDFLYFVIATPRDILYNRIDMRVDKMVDQGLFEETLSLTREMKHNNTSAQGIGYRETMWFWKGLTTHEETIRLIKRNTRHLAKRQMTWFGKNPDAILISIDEEDKCINVIKERWGI